MSERFEEIKDHFDYQMENGLLFGEQEEKLLHELYNRTKQLESENERLREGFQRIDDEINSNYEGLDAEDELQKAKDIATEYLRG